MEEKKSVALGYEYMVTSLGLPNGPRVQYLDLSADDEFIVGVLDRSIVLLDAVLMWVCRRGSCVAVVSGATHTIEAGQMLLVFADTHCRFVSISSDFEASAMLGRIPQNPNYNSLANAFPRIKIQPVLSLDKGEYNTLSAFLEYVKHSTSNPYNSHRSELDVNILALLHDELADMFMHRNFEVRESSADELLVKRFDMLLSVSTFEHRDVEYFAGQFNLSSKKFAQKIRRITGSNPSEMISAAVIKNAKRLLLSTELTSGEIAQRLHFATPSFFCRYFRRYTGLTPSEWRAANMV